MQELRSTAILNNEILEDARKKAEKILKKADAECQQLIDSVTQNVDKAISEKQIFFDKKIELFAKDENASLPLEKQRFEVSFIQKAICNNINDYLKSLTQEKRIELVMKQFDENILKTKKVKAFVYGFDMEEVKKQLSKRLGTNLLSCEKTIFGKMVIEDDFGLEIKEGIILETEDMNFRCRLTISEIISKILDNDRIELANTLFGEKI